MDELADEIERALRSWRGVRLSTRCNGLTEEESERFKESLDDFLNAWNYDMHDGDSDDVIRSVAEHVAAMLEAKEAARRVKEGHSLQCVRYSAPLPD